MLTHSWLKFVDVSLLTMFFVIRIQSYNIEVFDPEGLISATFIWVHVYV